MPRDLDELCDALSRLVRHRDDLEPGTFLRYEHDTCDDSQLRGARAQDEVALIVELRLGIGNEDAAGRQIAYGARVCGYIDDERMAHSLHSTGKRLPQSRRPSMPFCTAAIPTGCRMSGILRNVSAQGFITQSAKVLQSSIDQHL